MKTFLQFGQYGGPMQTIECQCQNNKVKMPNGEWRAIQTDSQNQQHVQYYGELVGVTQIGDVI